MSDQVTPRDWLIALERTKKEFPAWLGHDEWSRLQGRLHDSLQRLRAADSQAEQVQALAQLQSLLRPYASQLGGFGEELGAVGSLHRRMEHALGDSLPNLKPDEQQTSAIIEAVLQSAPPELLAATLGPHLPEISVGQLWRMIAEGIGVALTALPTFLPGRSDALALPMTIALIACFAAGVGVEVAPALRQARRISPEMTNVWGAFLHVAKDGRSVSAADIAPLTIPRLEEGAVTTALQGLQSLQYVDQVGMKWCIHRPSGQEP